MSTERALYRTPIVVSVLLHMAVLVPVLMPREPPGLAEGTGGSGFAVSIATADEATGAPGTEAPDIETIDAGPSPDEVSASMIEPAEAAAETTAEPIGAEIVEAVEPPVAEPDEADEVEPGSVAAAMPTTIVAAASPDAAEVPPEEVQAEVPTERLETVGVEDAATATTAQAPPTEKPAETSLRKRPAKADSVEMAERTATTGEQQDSAPKAKAGDGGTGSADSGSSVAAIDSSIHTGMADYQFLLQAWLERHKRYPRRAERRNLQGTAKLRFTIDRAGNVLSYRIQESSGHAVLDEEVEAMIRRAAPLPPAPPDMQSARLEFVVPVQFVLQ
jgi:protein TonB